MIIRLVTGCSWDVAGRLSNTSETTLRRRRDEWIDSGVFSALTEEALAAYGRVIGLELSHAAVDASVHKAPAGGEGTGPNFTDRAKLGWKWSLITDRNGIPMGWTAAGANQSDANLVVDTLDSADIRGLLAPVACVHFDKGYDYEFVRVECATRNVNCDIPKRRMRSPTASPATREAAATVASPGAPPKRPGTGGRSSGPTRGSATSVSSAATPTDASTTAAAPSNPPSRSSSPSSS